MAKSKISYDDLKGQIDAAAQTAQQIEDQEQAKGRQFPKSANLYELEWRYLEDRAGEIGVTLHALHQYILRQWIEDDKRGEAKLNIIERPDLEAE